MTSRFSPEGNEGRFDPAVAETHVSLLIFAGDRAYKLKKTIATDFLDFSSQELRRLACEREVQLNRRLAPDVYLGVADILGPDGQACDHLVVMRRMPPDRRLAQLVQSGSVEGCLEAVAETVASFHASAKRAPDIAAEGTRDAVLHRWEANFAETERLAPQLPQPELVEEIASLARAYLSGRKRLFDRRIEEDRICDGHGDMLADDVFCLDDGPRILDCLEFDDRLRYLDVLDDAAFLAMDLERLGGPEIGSRFLEAYRQASGESYPESLAHHYIAYRAFVRAKVALIRHEQGDEKAIDEAAQLLKISVRHLEAAQVVLLLVGGLPGTGKSTLARGLAGQGDGVVLRSDEVRKDLAGVQQSVHSDPGYGEGIYTQSMTEATYAALLDQARTLLGQGSSVILDASWSSAKAREAAAELGKECGAVVVALRCEAPSDSLSARIAQRARKGGDASDATPAIARSMATEFDPWPEAVAIDASGEPNETLDKAAQALAEKLAEARRSR